ncbi:MAG: arginine deiminase [Rhodothermia bacterium]|nr:arginine deiminase [Rhodothermia bacterium]
MVSPPSNVQASEKAPAPVTQYRSEVTSETGLLRQVIVHTPGPEMELVSPEAREDLLFEDILFLGKARSEHERMCSVFSKIVGTDEAVLQVVDLLLDVFQKDDARADFIDQLCRVSVESNLQAFQSDIQRLSPDELLHFALTGVSPLQILSRPLPNLMFTRDVAAVVNRHVVISHPATAARTREGIIIDTILRYHDAFRECRDNIIKLPRGNTFEGGDLLVVSEDTVLIGHSQRTSFGGVMTIARRLFDEAGVRNVVMVNLPKKRYCMHLDTVFTFASPTECAVFPPLIELTGLSNVIHFTPADEPDRLVTQVKSSLKEVLEELTGRDLTFIPCGGHSPLSQEREQWTDGANFFALAPGVVIGYERNERTFDMMREHGYRVVTAEGFLSYYDQSDWQVGEKIAIKLEGQELSRGRGGPRCMTLPFAREKEQIIENA